jgi:hypothetical protein
MKLLFTLFFTFLFSSAIAQDTSCPCCDEVHQQFDFWVGEWIVQDTLGNKVGENKISKQEEGCILIEKWTGSNGGSGTSMNYYDPSDSSWNQLWVNRSGNNLKLKGEYQDGQMVLKGVLKKNQNNTFSYNQIKWYKNEDGSVTQLWETFDRNGKLLQRVFKGIYIKKE